MKRKCAIYAIACVLGAVLWLGVLRLWPVPRAHPVTMALQSVTLTHDSYPMAEFVVTNAGFKPVYLDIRWRSDFPTNIVLPFSFFGSCHVPPGTNGTLSILGPSRPGPWHVRAKVCEPTSAFERGKFAARRLWARVFEKAAFSTFWITNSYSESYEIISPEVPGISRPLSSTTTLIQATETMEPSLWPLDCDPLTNTAN